MPSVQSLSSASSLLVAVGRRDPEAWRRLTAIYGPTVFDWGRRAGLQSADAADVMQQVFVNVAAHIGQAQWDRPGDTFRGWLWTIFHSRLMDFFRNQRRQPQAVGDSEVKRLVDEGPGESAGTASIADEDEAASLVRRALRTIRADFNEKTWQAFWRSSVAGEATSEIARDLGLTPAAVCMCRSRVLRRLRETLAGLGVVPEESE
jgi:RNA polymerase sigma-70 factor (ECF subfamily)